MTSLLEQRFTFLSEIEKLRGIDRHNVLIDGSRVENSAEHSWHLALYALTFGPSAPQGVSINRVIRMLLLHDIVEIDVGDHPIHHDVDWQAVQDAETIAAERIFGLLPEGRELHQLWTEFEAAETPDARFAKGLDRLQPLIQSLCSVAAPDHHRDICRENLMTGRALSLRDGWPLAYEIAVELLDTDIHDIDQSTPERAAFVKRLAFLCEADQLKAVLRASKLANGSRHENSAEHSWHIMMFAWALMPHATTSIDINRVLVMLLLHDLVEIDAGDMPIHMNQSAEDIAALEAKERSAAERIFGLLPTDQAAEMISLWSEFEAAESNDAIFAKSIDRIQPVLLNLANGGGSWVDYHVTLDQIDSRVGHKVAKGLPEVWDHVRALLYPWFVARGALTRA